MKQEGIWKWNFALLPRVVEGQMIWMRWIQKRTIRFSRAGSIIEKQYRLVDSSCWFCGHDWQPAPRNTRIVCPDCCCENNFED